MEDFCGALIPLFWTTGDISCWFQSQNGQHYLHLMEAYMLHILWDLPLVWHLLTSWWPACSWAVLFHVPANRYWWDSKFFMNSGYLGFCSNPWIGYLRKHPSEKAVIAVIVLVITATFLPQDGAQYWKNISSSH